MFTLFTSRHVGGLKRFSNILGSVILCGTFRRISQLWDDAHTLNLENCLFYLTSTISHFFDFVRRIVFDFIFYCVTAHTLYRWYGEAVVRRQIVKITSGDVMTRVPLRLSRRSLAFYYGKVPIFTYSSLREDKPAVYFSF